MKVLKIVLISLASLALLVLGGGFAFFQSLKPTYEGRTTVAGLSQQAEISYDAYGVPHISAQTDEDAFRALGYVHAQDRLWQMELIRRIAPGRLSEVFGPDMVETDQFFRTLGLGAYGTQSAAALRSRNGSESLRLLEAYLGGINEFVNHGPTPIEFTLVGLEKTPFTLEDVYNTMGYLAFSFANAHKTEPVVSAMASLGPEYLKAFQLEIPDSTAILRSGTAGPAFLSLPPKVSAVLMQLPTGPFMGSNSWVISPEKSTTGKVILCNDPHIGFAQPSVWYEAQLTSPGFNHYGHHLALIPFPMLIHSDRLATGLTMFENDDVDFFEEKINPENPGQYYATDHWEDFKVRREVIQVKGAEEVVLEVRETRHGPLINDVLPTFSGEKPIAMWWTYLQFPNQLAEAVLGMAKAKNIDDLRASAAMIHAPGLNVMYGDAQGNIAWWAAGKLVKRPDHVHAASLLDGASGKDEPVGYYDFSENPQSENPASGYVYSANNAAELHTAGERTIYPGYYLPENRARRIVQFLESKPKLGPSDMKTLLLDDLNLAALDLRDRLAGWVDTEKLSQTEKDALATYRAWDGRHALGAQGAALHFLWLGHAYELALRDEFLAFDSVRGPELLTAFYDTHMAKTSKEQFVSDDTHPWWDDVTTTDRKESRREVLTRAFQQSVAALTAQLGPDPAAWTWEKVHTVEHPHPMGRVSALRSYFNVGPFAVSGSDDVVNNLGFNYHPDEVHTVTYGPSTRRIVDFSNLENCESILPTGQSGNPSSPHYRDQAPLYHAGTWRPMHFTPASIGRAAKKKLVLVPN